MRSISALSVLGAQASMPTTRDGSGGANANPANRDLPSNNGTRPYVDTPQSSSYYLQLQEAAPQATQDFGANTSRPDTTHIIDKPGTLTDALRTQIRAEYDETFPFCPRNGDWASATCFTRTERGQPERCPANLMEFLWRIINAMAKEPKRFSGAFIDKYGINGTQDLRYWQYVPGTELMSTPAFGEHHRERTNFNKTVGRKIQHWPITSKDTQWNGLTQTWDLPKSVGEGEDARKFCGAFDDCPCTLFLSLYGFPAQTQTGEVGFALNVYVNKSLDHGITWADLPPEDDLKDFLEKLLGACDEDGFLAENDHTIDQFEKGLTYQGQPLCPEDNQECAVEQTRNSWKGRCRTGWVVDRRREASKNSAWLLDALNL